MHCKYINQVAKYSCTAVELCMFVCACVQMRTYDRPYAHLTCALRPKQIGTAAVPHQHSCICTLHTYIVFSSLGSCWGPITYTNPTIRMPFLP